MLAIELAPVEEGDGSAQTDWKAVFARSDAWVQAAAAFCTAQDPQLDLYGALPNDRRATQPIVFQHRLPIREAAAPAFSTLPAENEVYEPMFHG